jgi:hypothetical protein
MHLFATTTGRIHRAIQHSDSEEVPVGLGEPATTVVGPAIGNAIFAAVGAWLRQPTHPSGHRARSTHAREASAMKALTTIVAGPPWRWRFVAVFILRTSYCIQVSACGACSRAIISLIVVGISLLRV